MLGRDLDTHVNMIHQQMPLHDPTLLLAGHLVKDPAQARADLAVEGFAPILRNEHHVILAFPAGVRQALPCFRHTVLLRVRQQATLGGLYSCNAQSSSSRTSRTSGLPPMSIYMCSNISRSVRI